MEERRRVSGFDQRRRIDRAIAEAGHAILVILAETALRRASAEPPGAGIEIVVEGLVRILVVHDIRTGIGVACRAGAIDPDALEQILAALGGVIEKRQGREIDLLLSAKRALEGFERVELGIGRQAEIHTLDAIQGLGQMLHDGADRKLAQRAVVGRAVGRPAQGMHGLGPVGEDLVRIGVVIRGDRDGQGQRVRHAAQHGRAIEAVHILS